MFLFLLILSGSLFAAQKDPAILIDDPQILSELESLSLYQLIGSNSAKTAKTLKEFSEKDRAFAGLVETLKTDLEDAGRKDGKASVTLSTAHRLFDVRWLQSSFANFELAAIVNRLDRYPFNPEHCGETRLVYRLRYSKKEKGEAIVSRLPFTINLVFWQDLSKNLSDCKKTALRWQSLRNLSAQELKKKLIAADGPLSTELLQKSNLKSLEINLQAIRWPSTVKPDLAGHAEYFLRVFKLNRKGLWELSLLENTPDVSKLKSLPNLRVELLKWLNAHATDVADGVAVIPDQFLAKKVSSFSPRGLHRVANRPFSAIFEPKDFSQINFSTNQSGFVTSSEAFLRRLDDLSCAGCHQARTVAGFHLLGVDHADTSAVNFVNVTGSPHLLGDLQRRARFLNDVALGKSAKVQRPFSERSDEDVGGYGSHCGLAGKGFERWTCQSGLTCQPIGVEVASAATNKSHLSDVGFCFAPRAEVGDPCEVGRIASNENPTKDQIKNVQMKSCAQEGACYDNYGGFPDGMCGISCGTSNAQASCGAIAILKDFNACLGKGIAFTKCVRETTEPLGLRKCDDSNPCRDDYLCVRSTKNEGACIPPYFLFQMRVDGHPKPY